MEPEIHISVFRVKTWCISNEHPRLQFQDTTKSTSVLDLKIPHFFFFCRKEGILATSNTKMLRKIFRNRGEEVEEMEKVLRKTFQFEN